LYLIFKMPEQFHLKNISFSSSLCSSLSSLLATSSLCDCSLICSDGQLSAHKVVLAAASRFFSSVFSLHQHNHPLIYLRGIKAGQMQAVLDYVYSGATQVAEKDLASFLAVAEDLKIDGLNKCEEPLIQEKTETDPKGVTQLSELVNGLKDSLDETKRTSIEEKKETSAKITIDTNISEEIPCNPEPASCKIIHNHLIEKSRVIRKRKTMQVIADKQTHLKNTKCNSTRGTAIDSDNITPVTSNIYPSLSSLKGIPTTIYPQDHMAMKSATQCEDCKLFFRNCRSLAFHKKGRCRVVVSYGQTKSV